MALREIMTALAFDTRLAGRSLRRSPGFLLASVLSLGLATAAGVAGFVVLDAVRFRALPFPDADRLVLISEVPAGGCPFSCTVDYKTLALLREQRFRSIYALAGFAGGPKALGRGEGQIDLTVGIVSGSIFPMLGTSAEIGRTFSADEDKLGAIPTVLISHELWQNQFSGDRGVLGKTIILSDEPFTVIGVMPPGFSFESSSQVWLAASRYLDPRTGTSLRSVNVLARLAPGATAEQLTAELRTLEGAANEERPERLKTTFAVAPLRDRYVTATRSHDLVFAAIVSAILLIACANVSGLVLVRAFGQRRELAIRTSLGSSRSRLVRYLFLQNALLAAAGLVVGLLLAFGLLELLRVASPLQSLRAPGMEYRLDLRAFGFAAVASVVIAAVLSLAPMRLLRQIPVQQTLREGALNTTTSLQGNRMQQLFVVVQTACAVVLLVGTGIMVKTVLRFGGIALGYDAERIVQVTPVPAHAGRVREKYLPLNDRLLAEFAAIPGMQATALRASVPFGVGKPGEQPALLLDGARVPAAETQPRNAYGVSPDYFTVLGIPLLSGRVFTLADAENSPAVAIVNDWVAQHWWPGENAVGRTFTLETAANTRTSITVVGVVRDNLATQGSVLLAQPGPEIYRPYAQANFWVTTFYARASGAPAGRMLDEMQKAVMRQVPNGRPNGGIMAALVDRQVETVRSNALQIARFALIGLLLAITGLYGVLSNVVQQRTREIGIRGALGATPGRILTMVVSQALLLAAVGIAAGLLSAAFLLRLVRATLYGTPPLDLLVYAGVALLFLVVSFAASVLPARRAMRVDPTSALRAT